MYKGDIRLKFGNMRKEQDFTIYPFKSTDTHILIQSDKAIARINPTTGEMTYNTKGCYFVHLSMPSAQNGVLSALDLQTIKMQVFTNGEVIDIANAGIMTADNSGAINILDM